MHLTSDRPAKARRGGAAKHMFKPIVLATLVSGTLDIAFAIILTLGFGRQADALLRYVASGPFPAATEMELSGAMLGLLVHFALMAVIFMRNSAVQGPLRLHGAC